MAMCGANWRTRYFAVRGHRLHEEHERGAAELVHCPTAKMIADSLAKLATAPVIQTLHAASYQLNRKPSSITKPQSPQAHKTVVTSQGTVQSSNLQS